MNSLATKLSLVFILVVVIGVASVSILVRVETAREFESYVEAQGGNHLARVADSLVVLYRQQGNWSEAQRLLVSLQRGPAERLVLADASGHIVADTAGQQIGQSATEMEAVNQLPVMVEDSRAGTLYLLSFSPGAGSPQGRGPAAGVGQGRGAGEMAAAEKERAAAAGAQQVVASLESSYLASVDRAIFTAAILSALVAIAVGLIVSRRITRPLAELAGASREVASGRLDRRLEVASGDELGQVALSFNTMAEDLQRTEEARRHMVADIAHDLRTPLAVIQGTVDGMLDGVIASDRESLESVKEEVAILTKLVADLRTLSLAEAGQLKLEKVRIDLLELARRFVAKVEPFAAEKGVACGVDGTAPGPVVEVDMARMGQVVGNLLDNALRFTPKGGSVTVSVRAGEGERAILSVADTGTGIPPDELPRVFDRFYRADQSRTRKSGGSGLGLTIVKQLVEAHGGRVWAESQPGEGTRFSVELPAVDRA